MKESDFFQICGGFSHLFPHSGLNLFDIAVPLLYHIRDCICSRSIQSIRKADQITHIAVCSIRIIGVTQHEIDLISAAIPQPEGCDLSGKPEHLRVIPQKSSIDRYQFLFLLLCLRLTDS